MHRVSVGAKDDGHGRRRRLRRQRCLDAAGYDDRDAAADKIGCERRQPIYSVLRIPVLDRHVLALDIPGLLQALEKRSKEVLDKFSGMRGEVPDHRHRRLLRSRHDRLPPRAP